MGTTKVAVITRTRNRPTFLKRALASIHNQSMKDFVHVIVNDGGDPQVIEEILERNKKLVGDRVMLIHNTSSNGIEAASNKAIKKSNSKYIAIHDDDDTWHSDFLKLTTKTLDSSNVGGVVVKTNKIIEEIDEKSITTKKIQPWMPDMKVISLYRQCIENQMTPITFIFKRSCVEQVGYFDENLELCGDWDFGIRFLLEYDVDFLDPGYALANYHHRKYKEGVEGNTSYSGNEKHRYYTNKLANKYLRQELKTGRLGIGYIMGSEKHRNLFLINTAKKILPRFAVSQVRKKL